MNSLCIQLGYSQYVCYNTCTIGIWTHYSELNRMVYRQLLWYYEYE